MTGPRTGRGGSSVKTSKPLGNQTITETMRLTRNTPQGPSQSPPQSSSDLGIILAKLDHLGGEIKSMKEALCELVPLRADLQAHVDHTERENKLLKDRVAQLEKNDERREQKRITKNIVLKGFDHPPDKAEVSAFLEEKLQVDVRVTKVSGITIRDKHAFSIVTMDSVEDRHTVMSSKSKALAGTPFSINRDLTLREREIQCTIRKTAEEEKAKGRQVKTGYKFLKIDNKCFKCSQAPQHE